MVIGWMPAVSVFFRDPDGHLLGVPRDAPGWTATRLASSRGTHGRRRDERRYRIRLARPDEIARLRDIEDAAGTMFAGLELIDERLDGSFPCRRHGPPPRPGAGVGRVLRRRSSGRHGDRSLREGNAYVEELDVMPEFGRRGLGSRLLAAVCEWAREQRCAAVTLSTFRDVPWNGPFYRKRGFRSYSRGSGRKACGPSATPKRSTDSASKHECSCAARFDRYLEGLSEALAGPSDVVSGFSRTVRH